MNQDQWTEFLNWIETQEGFIAFFRVGYRQEIKDMEPHLRVICNDKMNEEVKKIIREKFQDEKVIFSTTYSP